MGVHIGTGIGSCRHATAPRCAQPATHPAALTASNARCVATASFLYMWCCCNSRQCAGDYFGIGVSGYPEAHPDVIVEDKSQMEKNYWSDIHYLKEKLDAGADFVITQLFYDVELFIKYVHDCRSVGITAPIIPGIMPIMAYGGFSRMTAFCKTYVPQEIKDKVESLREDEAGLKEYGVELGVQMCKKILDAKVSPGVHDALLMHGTAAHTHVL